MLTSNYAYLMTTPAHPIGHAHSSGDFPPYLYGCWGPLKLTLSEPTQSP